MCGARQKGIRVNSIAPTAAATPFFSNVMGIDMKKVEELLYASANLKGAAPEAEDVAEPASCLSSDEYERT